MVILTRHPSDFLNRGMIEDTGIQCMAADADGFSCALHLAAETSSLIPPHDEDDTLPVIFATNVGGAQLQALYSRAEQEAIRVCIVALGVAPAYSSATTGIELIALAQKIWGHRALSQASRLTPVGRPISVRGPQNWRQFLLLGTVTPPSANARVIAAPLCRLTWQAELDAVAGPLAVLVRHSRADEALAHIQRADTTCRRGGLQLQWDTKNFLPGADPGHHSDIAEPLSLHTLHWTGTAPEHHRIATAALDDLKAALAPISLVGPRAGQAPTYPLPYCSPRTRDRSVR